MPYYLLSYYPTESKVPMLASIQAFDKNPDMTAARKQHPERVWQIVLSLDDGIVVDSWSRE